MLYVYKKSKTPLNHWDGLRHGGANNIAPNVPAKYLVLWNVEILYRDGLWHYVMEFDARDSLVKSGLAQLALGNGQPREYPNDMDWRQWLGHDAEIISPAARWELMNVSAATSRHDAKITDMRELPMSSARGKGGESGRYQFILPPNFMLSVPEAAAAVAAQSA